MWIKKDQRDRVTGLAALLADPRKSAGTVRLCADHRRADRRLIFGENLARLYNMDIDATRGKTPGDAITQMKTACVKQGAEPGNSAYGWVHV